MCYSSLHTETMCPLALQVLALTQQGSVSWDASQGAASDAEVLEQLGRQLDPLWQALSLCISKIELGLKAQPTDGSQPSAVARMLPPGAAQVRGVASMRLDFGVKGW